MSTPEFSEWAGAWERHIVRRSTNPGFFWRREHPTHSELIQAQQQDQHELAEFNLQLAELVNRCTSLTEDTSADVIGEIKRDLDHCYDTACGLGADLQEQKDALTMLNEVITSAIRRALRDDDEHERLLLIKQESLRMRHLTRLSYPIVCDLTRSVPLIPENEIAAAMLCETDEAFTVALDVLDEHNRRYLAEGIEEIRSHLDDIDILFRINSKQKILQKRLIASHSIEEAETG